MQILDFSRKIRRSGNTGLVFLPGSNPELKRASSFYLACMCLSCARLPPLLTPDLLPQVIPLLVSAGVWPVTAGLWIDLSRFIQWRNISGTTASGWDLLATLCHLLCPWACIRSPSCPEETGADRNASFVHYGVTEPSHSKSTKLTYMDSQNHPSVNGHSDNLCIASCYHILCHFII